MRILNILDMSNYIYIGNAKKQYVIRGVREDDGQYIPNKAPIGGTTFLAEHILRILRSKEDILLAIDRRPDIKKDQYEKTFGFAKEYKGQRNKDLSVFKQKAFAEQLMERCEVPTGAVEGHEADDVIYTVWKYYYNEYDKIYIHSEDSDLAFMVDDKTEILPVKSTGRHITKENYALTVHKNEITPYNMSLLLKTFMGDKSDNISGTGDAVAWLEAIKPVMARQGITPDKFGDEDICRDVIKEAIKDNPNLKNAHMALQIFNLVTPCLCNINDIDIPSNSGNIPMLSAITGIQRPVEQYPEVEDLLAEYISEIFR